MFSYCVSVQHWTYCSKRYHHSVYCSFIQHCWNRIFLQNILQILSWHTLSIITANEHTILLQTFQICSYAVQDAIDDTHTVQYVHDDSALGRLALQKLACISLCSVRHALYTVNARTSYSNLRLTLSTMGNQCRKVVLMLTKNSDSIGTLFVDGLTWTNYNCYLYLHWEYFASSLLLLHVWWASALNPLWQMCPSASIINWYSFP
jgi:hypothetical protein